MKKLRNIKRLLFSILILSQGLSGKDDNADIAAASCDQYLSFVPIEDKTTGLRNLKLEGQMSKNVHFFPDFLILRYISGVRTIAATENFKFYVQNLSMMDENQIELSHNICKKINNNLLSILLRKPILVRRRPFVIDEFISTIYLKFSRLICGFSNAHCHMSHSPFHSGHAHF